MAGVFITAVIIGAFTFILLLYVLFRYRRRSDDMPRQSQYHTLTEIMYTVVPILVVIGLFVATVVVENKVTAVEPSPYTKVNVYAFQWGWEFKYQNGVRVIGQTTAAPTMVIPSNETVRVTLRSLDVLHGFYVPAFNCRPSTPAPATRSRSTSTSRTTASSAASAPSCAGSTTRSCSSTCAWSRRRPTRAGCC